MDLMVDEHELLQAALVVVALVAAVKGVRVERDLPRDTAHELDAVVPMLVDLHVLLQIRAIRKLLAALLARKRLLTGVYVLVADEVGDLQGCQ